MHAWTLAREHRRKLDAAREEANTTAHGGPAKAASSAAAAGLGALPVRMKDHRLHTHSASAHHHAGTPRIQGIQGDFKHAGGGGMDNGVVGARDDVLVLPRAGATNRGPQAGLPRLDVPHELLPPSRSQPNSSRSNRTRRRLTSGDINNNSRSPTHRYRDWGSFDESRRALTPSPSPRHRRRRSSAMSTSSTGSGVREESVSGNGRSMLRQEIEQMYAGARPLTAVARPVLVSPPPAPAAASTPARSGWRATVCTLTAWAVFIELLVVATTSAQIIVLSESDFEINRASVVHWNNLLFPPDVAPSDSVDNVANIFTQQQAVNTIRQISNVYYNVFSNNSVDFYRYPVDSEGRELPILLRLELLPQPANSSLTRLCPVESVSDDQPVLLCRLVPGYIGPFDDDTRADVFAALSSLSLSFNIFHVEFEFGQRYCLEWEVKYRMSYATARGGHLFGFLDVSQGFCPHVDLKPRNLNTLVGVAVLTASASMLSLAFVLWPVALCGARCAALVCQRWGCVEPDLPPDPTHYMTLEDHAHSSPVRLRGASLNQETPQRPLELCSASHNPALRQCFPRLSGWWALAVFTDFCNLSTSILEIHRRVSFTKEVSSTTLHFFLGLGCLLAWLRLVPGEGVLGPKARALATTLVSAGPFLLKLLVGVLPLFFGFVLYGVALYSTVTRKFKGFDMGSMSLYAMLNGDMIMDTFTVLRHEDRMLGQLYVYVFLVMFLLVVTKLVLAGVEYFFFLNVPAAADVMDYEEQLESNTSEKDSTGLLHNAPVEPARVWTLADTVDSAVRDAQALGDVALPLLLPRTPLTVESRAAAQPLTKCLLQLWQGALHRLREDIVHVVRANVERVRRAPLANAAADERTATP